MDPQVKQLQIEMKKLGLYDGPTDGVMGPGTKAAIDLYERKKREEDSAKADRQAKIDRDAADAKAERERKDREAAAKLKAEQDAAQAERDQITGAVTAGSIATGVGTGFGGAKIAEHFAGPAHKAEMSARNDQLKRLAAAIRAIDPTSKDARVLHKDAAAAAEAGRLTKRPIPWGTSATAVPLLGFGAYSSFERAPQSKSDLERAVWTGTGYAELSAGAKMLADSLRRFRNPGMAYDADAEAAVNASRRIAAGGPVTSVTPSSTSAPYDPSTPSAPAAPAPPPAPTPGSRTDLYNQAKARGLPVTTKTRKADIEKILSEALKKSSRAAKKAPKAIVPLSAGFGVYDALRSPAEAADGTATEPMSRGEAAAIGGAAAGGTALAGAGLNRLARALGEVGRRGMQAAGAGFRIATPSAMVDITDGLADIPPQRIVEHDNEILNSAVRRMPFMRHLMQGHADAYDMAQVPERNPQAAGPRISRLPEGVPLRQPQPSAMPEEPAPTPGAGGELDALVAAAADDPEMAAMLRDLIEARLSGAVPQ